MYQNPYVYAGRSLAPQQSQQKQHADYTSSLYGNYPSPTPYPGYAPLPPAPHHQSIAAYSSGPPPPETYVCHSCGQRGAHWVTNCPAVTGGGSKQPQQQQQQQQEAPPLMPYHRPHPPRYQQQQYPQYQPHQYQQQHLQQRASPPQQHQQPQHLRQNQQVQSQQQQHDSQQQQQQQPLQAWQGGGRGVGGRRGRRGGGRGGGRGERGRGMGNGRGGRGDWAGRGERGGRLGEGGRGDNSDSSSSSSNPFGSPSIHPSALTMAAASQGGAEAEPVVAAVEEGEDAEGAYKCAPCDKAFQTESQHAAHISAHEECHYPTCTFQGSRQVVGGHYRVAHGKYRGNGFRVLKVEGRSFRILVGNAPEEVEQWREDRRKNFPTAENVAKRRMEMRGGRGGREGGGKKRPRAEEVDEGRGGSKQARAECGGGLLGFGEAYASEGQGEQEVLGNEEIPTVVRTAVEKEADVAMRTSLLYGVCRAYLRNQCPLSAARCRYRHGPTKGGGGLMYCRFYTKPGGGCHHGEGCQFVHDQSLKEELERWVVERRAQKKEEREAEVAEGEMECGTKRPGKTIKQQKQQQQQQSTAGTAAATGPSRELTLLKRLLGMEVEKETNLVLGCIRYLVEENFFKNKTSPVSSSVVSRSSLSPVSQTSVAGVMREGGEEEGEGVIVDEAEGEGAVKELVYKTAVIA